MTTRPAPTPSLLTPPPSTRTAPVGIGAAAYRALSADRYPFEPGP